MRDYYGSGWLGPGLTLNFFARGKLSQNSPKPVVIFLSSIPCVFCLDISKSCWLLLFSCSVHVSDWFNKNWMAGGWVGWALSIFVWIFWNLFNFAKPLCAVVEIWWVLAREIELVFELMNECYIGLNSEDGGRRSRERSTSRWQHDEKRLGYTVENRETMGDDQIKDFYLTSV